MCGQDDQAGERKTSRLIFSGGIRFYKIRKRNDARQALINVFFEDLLHSSYLPVF